MEKHSVSAESHPLRSSIDSDDGSIILPKPEVSLAEALRQHGHNLTSSTCWVIGCFMLYFSVLSYAQIQTCPPIHHQIHYSPAQDVINYKEVMFTNGFTQLSKYQGRPSSALDKAWSDLYTHVTRVPEAQAVLLLNETVPIPNDPGYYAVILDVFHSLHCLDEVRKTMATDHYGSFASRYGLSEEIGTLHMDHCVDNIRQALMCGADISPLPFFEGKEEGEYQVSAKYLHTCRDWDAIEQWAIENEIVTNFRPKKKEHML